MKFVIMCIAMLCILSSTYSQKTEIEFVPAIGEFYPYVNSFSETEGLKQYYYQNSTWVRNNSIPAFKDKKKFKNIGLQYIGADEINSPQLFVYSKSSGDFSFYFLAKEGWLINEKIPSGKINLESKSLISKYSPPKSGLNGYIFSYTSDGSLLELLEITDNRWSKSIVFPKSLVQN